MTLSYKRNTIEAATENFIYLDWIYKGSNLHSKVHLTEWFPPNTFPEKRGLYQTVLPATVAASKNTLLPIDVYYSYWSGTFWSKGYRTISELRTAFFMEPNPAHRHKFWRGILFSDKNHFSLFNSQNSLFNSQKK